MGSQHLRIVGFSFADGIGLNFKWCFARARSSASSLVDSVVSSIGLVECERANAWEDNEWSLAGDGGHRVATSVCWPSWNWEGEREVSRVGQRCGERTYPSIAGSSLRYLVDLFLGCNEAWLYHLWIPDMVPWFGVQQSEHWWKNHHHSILQNSLSARINNQYVTNMWHVTYFQPNFYLSSVNQMIENIEKYKIRST